MLPCSGIVVEGSLNLPVAGCRWIVARCAMCLTTLVLSTRRTDRQTDRERVISLSPVLLSLPLSLFFIFSRAAARRCSRRLCHRLCHDVKFVYVPCQADKHNKGPLAGLTHFLSLFLFLSLEQQLGEAVAMSMAHWIVCWESRSRAFFD